MALVPMSHSIAQVFKSLRQPLSKPFVPVELQSTSHSSRNLYLLTRQTFSRERGNTLVPRAILQKNMPRLLKLLPAVPSTSIFDLTIGKIKPHDMVTGRIPLEKTHKDGFLELIHNKDQHIKILVSPTLAK